MEKTIEEKLREAVNNIGKTEQDNINSKFTINLCVDLLSLGFKLNNKFYTIIKEKSYTKMLNSQLAEKYNKEIK